MGKAESVGSNSRSIWIGPKRQSTEYLRSKALFLLLGICQILGAKTVIGAQILHTSFVFMPGNGLKISASQSALSPKYNGCSSKGPQKTSDVNGLYKPWYSRSFLSGRIGRRSLATFQNAFHVLVAKDQSLVGPGRSILSVAALRVGDDAVVASGGHGDVVHLWRIAILEVSTVSVSPVSSSARSAAHSRASQRFAFKHAA